MQRSQTQSLVLPASRPMFGAASGGVNVITISRQYTAGAREAYYRYLFNLLPDDLLLYDMVLNTSRVSMEEAAAIVTASFGTMCAARSTQIKVVLE